MRKFSMLLLLIVAAFAGYTHWQVIQLQREVRGSDRHVAGGRVTITETEDTAALVAQARQHCRRAQSHMDRGQTRRAKQELDLCLQKLGRAADLSEGSGKGSRELIQGWQEIRRQIDALWKDFAQQAKPQKGS